MFSAFRQLCKHLFVTPLHSSVHKLRDFAFTFATIFSSLVSIVGGQGHCATIAAVCVLRGYISIGSSVPGSQRGASTCVSIVEVCAPHNADP